MSTNKTDILDPLGRSPEQWDGRPRGLARSVGPPGSELFQPPGLPASLRDARPGFGNVHSTSNFCIKNRMNHFALMKCRPYLYIRLVLPSVWIPTAFLPTPDHRPGASFWGSEGCARPPSRTSGRVPPPSPHSPPPKPSIRLLSGIQSDENTVNALTGGFLVLFHIMCNVVALTFYATIYEDLCCTCNKYIEKAHTSYGELYGFVRVLGAGWGGS